MRERARRLRLPSRETRRRRTARWLRRRRRPLGRALIAAGRVDQRLLVLLRTRGHDPRTDRIAQGLGMFGEMGVGWTALAASCAVLRPERRRSWLAAAAVAPTAILVNFSVKLVIGRKRPLIEDHPPLARAPSKLSFPSAHSTSSVAAATALGRVSPRARPGLLGLAGAVCLSRPYLGMHYPSDVLAGATLGYLLGRALPLPQLPRRPPAQVETEVREVPAPAPPGPPATAARGGGGD